MKTRTLATLFMLFFAACGQRDSPPAVFAVPAQMTLYSIREDQVPHSEQASQALDIEALPLLGKTEITDPQQRQEIIDNLNQHAQVMDVESCFNPRHGIRAIDGAKRTDYIICFECTLMYVISDGKKVGYTLKHSAQATLNKILVEAGVPLNNSR